MRTYVLADSWHALSWLVHGTRQPHCSKVKVFLNACMILPAIDHHDLIGDLPQEDTIIAVPAHHHVPSGISVTKCHLSWGLVGHFVSAALNSSLQADNAIMTKASKAMAQCHMLHMLLWHAAVRAKLNTARVILVCCHLHPLDHPVNYTTFSELEHLQSKHPTRCSPSSTFFHAFVGVAVVHQGSACICGYFSLWLDSDVTACVELHRLLLW